MPTDMDPLFSPPLIYLVLFISIWELVWKGVALWRAARNGNKGWFIAMLIFNTVGILPIAYIIGHPGTKKPAE